MSFPAIAWAVRQKLPCPQKIVLVMLADRHNKDTGQCNPSHERLADDCGLTRRSIMDQIEKLSVAGYIRIIHRFKVKLKLPNQYMLMLGFGVQEVVNDVHIEEPGITQEVVNVIHQVVNDVPKGSEPVAHKPVIEPVIEPIKKKSAAAPSRFILPDWINETHWDAWHSCDKRKKATDAQKLMTVAKLDAWRSAGIDHAEALENAAIGGWAGLHKPDEKKQVFGAPALNKQEALEASNNAVAARFLQGLNHASV